VSEPSLPGAEAFRTLATRLDPAMAVVTTVEGNERAGCLVGFHAQCSIAPFRYAVWLSKANHTFRVASRADVLAVHFLDRSQIDVATLFGTLSGDDVDKLALCGWDRGPGGVPLVRSCPNRFASRRLVLLDEGSDHACFVLEPMAFEGDGDLVPMRLSDVAHLDAGHEAQERPAPPTERAS
jgi:flavin reductase (DIM6/NTAB) family NADH-FMN oxidoreductase RutF